MEVEEMDTFKKLSVPGSPWKVFLYSQRVEDPTRR